MLYITIALFVLVGYTWIKWDTVSPKLVVREASTLVGSVAGATPEVVRTTVKLAKAANAVTELDLKEAGSQGPIGFREGRIVTQKAVRDTFRSTNVAADKAYKEAIEALKALDAK